ncbi:HAMP domain-containing histidine kinase [Candidatus Kaiserbacteria bacterium]|nr:HAMP domain-containing histidine kinase [Candidatus Kaiserbacteria bacterium]
MISYIVDNISNGARYLREHPQLLFVLTLLIVIPLLFLYSGQQFLDAGRSNQDRLQKDRVGVLHDVFASLVSSSNFNQDIIQNEIERIAFLNNDLVEFMVVKIDRGIFTPIASLDRSKIGQIEEDIDGYVSAAANTNQSFIFEVSTPAGRKWYAYRAIQSIDGTFYVIHTVTSLETIDKLFTQRERSAFLSLMYIFVFIIVLAYWHVRMTDYRYLYRKEMDSNNAKDTFINMMAHELRAPLTAIRGYSEMLQDSRQDTSHPEYAKRIEISSERLLDLITDLLDVARIQSGSMSVTLAYVNVSLVVETVMKELEITAGEKSIKLVSSGIETPHQAIADEGRLHQVLTNIVNNSIKYTNQGQIEIQVTQKRNSLEIRIKDTGMGIEADDQKKLFAPFFRVKNSDVTAITGSGLGMWITKQLVSIMNGKIGVESIRGVGTHIVLTLPTKIEDSGK